VALAAGTATVGRAVAAVERTLLACVAGPVSHARARLGRVAGPRLTIELNVIDV
jgi:hypothetical protein